MKAIRVPREGRPSPAVGADALVGIDGNAFSIIGKTSQLLKRGGCSEAFKDAYVAEAMSGDYHHVLAASMAYLEADDKWDNLKVELT